MYIFSSIYLTGFAVSVLWLLLIQIEGLLDTLTEPRPPTSVSAAFIVLMAAFWPLAMVFAVWDIIDMHRHGRD